MRRAVRIVVAAAALACVSGPASAQTMPLNEFIRTADRIPRNATALLRPDFHRIKREAEAAMSAVLTEQYRAQQANRPSPTCIPMESFRFNPEDMLRSLKAIPDPQRPTMTITDGLRQVLRRQYPCPGG
jgi:hypothetical protein